MVETGLTLLANAHLPLQFWDEAFYTATCLINKLPTPILSYKTPYEMLFHKIPDYLSLKVFGCSCFPLIKPYNKHKMDFKSVECTFIGYSPSHKGYKCLTPSGKVIISRHVTFNESIFPFAAKDHNIVVSHTAHDNSTISFSLAQPPIVPYVSSTSSFNAQYTDLRSAIHVSISRNANISGSNPVATMTGDTDIRRGSNALDFITQNGERHNPHQDSVILQQQEGSQANCEYGLPFSLSISSSAVPCSQSQRQQQAPDP